MSTKVGGIPEVLPSDDAKSDIMILCEPNIDGTRVKVQQAVIYIWPLPFLIYSSEVFRGLCRAIERIKQNQMPDAVQWHEKIKTWYSWSRVAQHTEIVYNHVTREPSIDLKKRLERFVEQRTGSQPSHRSRRICISFRYRQCGLVSGFVMGFVAFISYLIFLYLDYSQPRRNIDLSVDCSKEKLENYQ